ncbi:MAG: ABC transporter permease [Mangrovibacterium sp.]
MLDLKLIVRRLFRKKGIVAINVFGLSIALCASLFLSLYVAQEISYDKHIPHHEHIYRLLTIWREGERTEILPINLSEDMLQFKNRIPEVKDVVQIYRGGDSYFKVGDHVIADNPTFQADPSFFRVFDFKTIYGTQEGALNSPEKIVISEKTSLKVFGDRNPVGEEVFVDGKTFNGFGSYRECPAEYPFLF